MKKRIKGISIGAGLTLLMFSPSFSSIDVMLAAHETDSAKISRMERNLPFMEAKVASTLRDGASKPVSFDGLLQVRSQFHNFSGLADSSWLSLSKQGFTLNQDQPFLRLGMVVAPGRNTILWSTVGLNASFAGYNSYQFLNPFTRYGTADNGWYFDFQHHSSGSAGRGVIGYEDLNAGFAVRTRPASFMLKMGSMNWIEASPLSIWSGSKRAFAWERLAYEIEQPISQYFNYKIASLEQVGRGVWNKQPFQGIDFSVIDLPWGLRGFFLYGVGQPFDKNQRYHIDMAVDVGYAGDAGSIVEAGIADSYRKFIFYRLSKQLAEKDITFSINNGYVRSSSDAVFSGYSQGASFNQKFDIGRFGSEWTNGSKTVKLNSQKELDEVLSWGDDAKAVSLGEGFLVEPNVLGFDVKGSIGKNFRFSFDVAGSWVDTHFIRIDPNSYDDHAGYMNGSKNNPIADIFNGGGIGNPDVEPYSVGTKHFPGWILDKRTETSSPDIAVYGSGTYDFKTIQTSLEMFFATKNFNSPYSVVNSSEAFFPFGSNMLGTQTFLNASGSEYAKNSRALKLTLTPKTPSWHGYLKFGYGLVSQNNKSRDIIALPYRLNGAVLHQSLNHWYAKWGAGTVTETYDFTHYQGGSDDWRGEMGTIAKHTQNRFGDQSLIATTAPHAGGLRSDFDGVSEIFVPFETPEQVIFNYFSGSTVESVGRDLQNVWQAGTPNYSYTKKGEKAYNKNGGFVADGNGVLQFTNNIGFVNMVDHINSINNGQGVRVTDENGVNYYKVENISGSNGEVVVRNANGDEISRKTTSLKSESAFVPVSLKRSFDLNVDWALNIGKYIGYKNDLFLSLYYQTSGVTRKFAPLAFKSAADNDVLLVSHYLRSEPTIGLTKNFYLTTLFGFEKWMSGQTWTGEYQYMGKALNGEMNNGGLAITNNGNYGGTTSSSANSSGADYYTLTGIKRSNLETTDWALGVGFDWDMMKRVSLSGRYKWIKHIDENMPFNNYIGNIVSLELKAFF